MRAEFKIVTSDKAYVSAYSEDNNYGNILSIEICNNGFQASVFSVYTISQLKAVRDCADLLIKSLENSNG